MSNQKNIILQTNDLYKIFGKDDSEIIACNNINLEIYQGETISIIGQSGSGKSTLLHMLGGLEYPTKGEVIFDNNNIFSLNESELTKYRCEKVGFVFQAFRLLPELTVKENILMPVLLDNKIVDNEYFDNIINILGIKDKLYSKPSQLSGGQQQRVAIARAVINSPEIILCDEPTGNLDIKSGEDVMKLLMLINEKYNKTIVLVTHDMKLADMTERIIKIQDGKII